MEEEGEWDMEARLRLNDAVLIAIEGTTETSSIVYRIVAIAENENVLLRNKGGDGKVLSLNDDMVKVGVWEERNCLAILGMPHRHWEFVPQDLRGPEIKE